MSRLSANFGLEHDLVPYHTITQCMQHNICETVRVTNGIVASFNLYAVGQNLTFIFLDFIYNIRHVVEISEELSSIRDRETLYK